MRPTAEIERLKPWAAMKRMTIGTLSAASGVKVTTIRFYERAGLLPQPPRTAGRHRNYADEQLRRLLFICKARELEFSIEDIRALLAIAEAADTSCGEIQRLTASHLNNLRHRIAHLIKTEAVLCQAVERCSRKSIAPCPILQLLESTG